MMETDAIHETDAICTNDEIESMFQDPNMVRVTNDGRRNSLNFGFEANLGTHMREGELDGLDVNAAMKAFRADSNAKLFIVVVNKKIYYIHKTLSIDPTDISDINRGDINKKWMKLKKSIETEAVKKDKVISFGKKVYETLLYKYLFSWDNVPNEPRKVDATLLSFLTGDLDLEWAGDVKIWKTDEDNTIHIISEDGKSAEITICDGGKKATIKVNDGTTYDLKVKNEGGKQNIYVNKKISNGSNETSGVWIYCRDEKINPIWEWLYDEDGKFFWGDKFHIVRIAKGCDMAKECTLNALIILGDNTPPTNDTAEYMISSIKPNLKHLTPFLHLRSLASFQNNAVDNPNFLELLKSCMLYFPMDLPGEVLADLDNIFKNRNNKNLLLYLQGPLTCFSNYPSTWIDSKLEKIPESQTSQFFKYFCDVLDEHLANPEKANIAEIVTETRKKMCGQELNDQGGYNFWGLLKLHLPAVVGSHLPHAREESNAIFWRLAYVVNGNPRTYLGC